MRTLFFIAALPFLTLAADCCSQAPSCEDLYPYRNQFEVGPEFYHIKREREGGTWQKGNLAGVRASYDHFKRFRLYWGAEGFYGSGTLKGKTGSDDKIKSRLTDEFAEGRLGYTFQSKGYPYISFTPYGGVGYFRETNHFKSPSPIKVKFTTTYPFAAYGFFFNSTVNDHLTVGLNVRFRSPWDLKCKMTDDPDFDSTTQIIKEKLQTRIEIPIFYQNYPCYERFELGITPFYEFRHYGGRENFPFDFFDTKFKIYGFNVLFRVLF